MAPATALPDPLGGLPGGGAPGLGVALDRNQLEAETPLVWGCRRGEEQVPEKDTDDQVFDSRLSYLA